ncbi:MAG: hypothetical protein JNK82_41235 [Myxococcaceae bacterium]|nr:hypothetical protein [Myxococcaceae bacterium]
MEALRTLALETTRGDVAAAEALLADPDALRELERKLQAAEAANRVEAWKALKPKAQWALVPLIVAFAVGLSAGGGLGLVRFTEPPPTTLTVNAAAPTGPYVGEQALELSFTLPQRSAVVLRFEALEAELELDGMMDLEAVLEPGEHHVRLFSKGGEWSVGGLQIEALPLPPPDARDLRHARERAADDRSTSCQRWNAERDAALLGLSAGELTVNQLRQLLGGHGWSSVPLTSFTTSCPITP